MAENVGNLWTALLNGAIDDDDTSVAFDNAVGALPDADFRIIVQDSETGDTNREIMLVTAGTSTPLTVTRGQEGTTPVAHGDNSYIAHVLTAGALVALLSETASPLYDLQQYVAGDISLTSTSVVALPGLTDLVVEAEEGDVLLVGLSWSPHTTTSASMGADFATIVSGSPVNYITPGSGTPLLVGNPMWYIASGELGGQGGTWPYVVQAGDIENGTVTLQLYYRVSSTRVINAEAAAPLTTWVVNDSRRAAGVSTTQIESIIDENLSTYACLVTREAALDITTTLGYISWDNEVRDDGGFWDAGDPTKLTIPVDGWYMVGGSVRHGSSNNDYVLARVQLNGTDIEYQQDVDATNGREKSVTFGRLHYLTAGQYVQLNAISQATQALQVGPQMNFWIAKVAASTAAPPFPRALVSRAAAYSSPTSAAALPWDTEELDVGDVWDSGTPTRLTAPENGLYTMGFNLYHASTTNDDLWAWILLNGTTVILQAYSIETATGPKSIGASRESLMTAGDYIEIFTLSGASTAALSVGPAQAAWLRRVA